MRDYIREVLANYDAPPRIYDKICKALENPALTEIERKELLGKRWLIREFPVNIW